MLENNRPRPDAISLSRPEELVKKARTAPLTLEDHLAMPSGLTSPDQLKPPRIPTQPLVPAQNSAISQALEAPLTDQEAEALIVGSKNLSDLHQSAPALFKETMQALSVQGRQGNLSSRQQELLAELGLPLITAQVSSQLYQMMLPVYQGQASDAFKVAQQAVTGFMSKMKVEEHTLKKIEKEAKDLVRSSETISGLTAGSISNLLEDKTAEAYDMAVSQIDSDNFDIKTGMDYTLGQFIVKSQNEPQLLQQAGEALKKLQQKQTLNPAERSSLAKLGLTVNAQGQVQDQMGKPVSAESLDRLQDVAYSMMDPTPAYQSVLKASADVITQSGKLLALSKQAETQAQLVEQETKVLIAHNQDLNQIRQETATVNQQLVQTMSEAEQLQKILVQNTGLAAPAAAAPQVQLLQPNQIFLAKFNVQLVTQPGGQAKFLVNGQEVSQLGFIQHLSQELKNKKAEMQELATDLQEKRSDLIKSASELQIINQQAAQHTSELELMKTSIEAETIKLQDLQLVYQSTVAKVSGQLKPSESAAFTVSLQPFIQSYSERAKTVPCQVLKHIAKVLTPSYEIQAQNRQDIQLSREQYQETGEFLSKKQDLDQKIDTTIAGIEEISQASKGQPASPGRRQERLTQEQPFVMQYQAAEERSNRDISAGELENRKMQQKMASRLEGQHLARQLDEERYQAQWEAKRENEVQYQQDRQTLKDEQKRILDDA